MYDLDRKEVEQRVSLLRRQYKPGLQDDESETDVFRVTRLYRGGGRIVDLGGGISVHNGVLAQLGMKVYVVDILNEYWEQRATMPSSIDCEMRVLEDSGVRFIQAEISTCDLRRYFADNSVDIVTSFHCIEHLHRSPRLVLESAMRVLKPGGSLIIEVPNAVNARKRLAVLCGRTNYGTYNSLYNSDLFWGHVREYTIGDLRQLAHNLGPHSYRISGRNTIYGHWVRKISPDIRRFLDGALRAFPSLCSALVLDITKAQSFELDSSKDDSELARSMA